MSLRHLFSQEHVVADLMFYSIIAFWDGIFLFVLGQLCRLEALAWIQGHFIFVFVFVKPWLNSCLESTLSFAQQVVYDDFRKFSWATETHLVFCSRDYIELTILVDFSCCSNNNFSTCLDNPVELSIDKAYRQSCYFLIDWKNWE